MSAALSPDAVVARVQAIVVEIAGPHRTPPGAGPDTPLGEDGFWLDSVDLLEILVACQAAFGTEFDVETDLTEHTLHSARRLAEKIRAKALG